MAKKEQNVKTTNNKKSKAKKRKHTATENDDEVANKSLILETVKTAEQEPEAAPEIKLKRKNKSKSTIKEKRSKLSVDDTEDAVDEKDDNEELHEPTLDELRESEKPENTKAILTVRQKKKQKHLERVAAQKHTSAGKDKQRNAEYLQKWKHARDDWKFEKLRQISIQQTMFDAEKVDANVWPLALEYLSGSKGAAKDKITKLAEQVIDELDKHCEDLEDESARQTIMESTRYQRSRELLQSFD